MGQQSRFCHAGGITAHGGSSTGGNDDIIDVAASAPYRGLGSDTVTDDSGTPKIDRGAATDIRRCEGTDAPSVTPKT